MIPLWDLIVVSLDDLYHNILWYLILNFEVLNVILIYVLVWNINALFFVLFNLLIVNISHIFKWWQWGSLLFVLLVHIIGTIEYLMEGMILWLAYKLFVIQLAFTFNQIQRVIWLIRITFKHSAVFLTALHWFFNK